MPETFLSRILAGLKGFCLQSSRCPEQVHSHLHFKHTEAIFLVPVQGKADSVKSYVGMRKISLGRVGPGNQLRPLLNNEFVFQLGFLDQARPQYFTSEPYPQYTNLAFWIRHVYIALLLSL
jgi:hypothetical protein